MFGFHQRHRSLISVRNLEEEKEPYVEESEDEILETEYVIPRSPDQRRNLFMIYLLFLAEAIMASSLSSQVAVLVPAAEGCMSMSASFLRSTFECAYFLGCAAGIFWGWMADRAGRRRTAVLGLLGMCICCMSMGFATKFVAFAVLRLVAGAISSAVKVAGLTMLADLTHGDANRAVIVARLPLIAVCGGFGSYVAKAIRDACATHAPETFAKYPGLSGQIVCASLVFTIALIEACVLEETLPQRSSSRSSTRDAQDPEKASFLGQSLSNDSEDSLNISIMEALNDDAGRSPTSKVGISQMLSAPTIAMLLASYSILSLHSATFDILLPHLGHTDSHMGGMGIPCSWLRPVDLVVRVFAACSIMHYTPSFISRKGLLPAYRKLSLFFPALFVIVPTTGAVLHAAGAVPAISAVISANVMLAKDVMAGAAEVLVLLLILSAAPDASSTGTVIGVIFTSQLFKALAVGISGIAYYVADGYSVLEVNVLLWSSLATTAAVGAAISWRLRETPRIGTDIPEGCLAWQGMFDSESEDEGSF